MGAELRVDRGSAPGSRGDLSRGHDWLDLYVNQSLEFLLDSARETNDDFVPTHPKGYFQPGILALTSDRRVLYRWRSVPGRKNIGGATRRPTPQYVWKEIEQARAAGDADAALDANPELDAPAAPWPLFVSLLLANGWFVRPRAFRDPKTMLPRAQKRLLGFLAAWGAAFAFLPTLPVALAAIGYAAYITPKVRWLNKEFQSV